MFFARHAKTKLVRVCSETVDEKNDAAPGMPHTAWVCRHSDGSWRTSCYKCGSYRERSSDYKFLCQLLQDWMPKELGFAYWWTDWKFKRKEAYGACVTLRLRCYMDCSPEYQGQDFRRMGELMNCPAVELSLSLIDEAQSKAHHVTGTQR